MSNRGSPSEAPAFIFSLMKTDFSEQVEKLTQGDYSRHKSGIGEIWENGNGVSRYSGRCVRDMVRP